MKLNFIRLLFSILLFISCSTKAIDSPIITETNKLSSCDSIRSGLLKTRQDTVRLLSCLSITGCDSIRLGILEPTKLIAERLKCAVTKIGEKFNGGILIYILKPTDPGYEASMPHGFIVANEIFRSRWYNGVYINTGALATSIGSGLINTNTVNLKQGLTQSSYATGIARAYNGGGYSDWFLPSKEELNIMFLNKTSVVSCVDNLYWSSSEFSSNFAWAQDFGTGFQLTENKELSLCVCPIRYF